MDDVDDKGTPDGALGDAPVATRRRRKLPELEPEALTGDSTTRLYRVFEVTDNPGGTVDGITGPTMPAGRLTFVGDVAAVNDKDAIKAAIAEDRAGTFVAIAERYYNPRTRALVTVTQEAWT